MWHAGFHSGRLSVLMTRAGLLSSADAHEAVTQLEHLRLASVTSVGGQQGQECERSEKISLF